MKPTPELQLHRLDPRRLPVVLLGGINLVRTAGLAGLPAIVAASDPDEPAFASRHCAAAVGLPRLDRGEAVAEALVELGEALVQHFGRRVPLLYGSDDALEVVSAHRERLARYFLVLLNDPEVACALIAKDRFQAFARHRGLPVPRSLAWEGEGPGTLRGAAGQVLAKPSTKVDWHQSALCEQLFGGDGKARVFASGAQAAADPVVAVFHRQLTFQEYIPGDDTDLWSYHGFADERGQVLASFTGRKLRTYPAGNGESAFIELRDEPSLAAVGAAVARACPLKGLFKMDFKRDPRDGRWYLLEVNARCTLWHYLGAVNGLNLMRVAVDYLVDGIGPPARRPACAYRWLSLQLDYKAFRELAARGELDVGRWLASILASRNVYNVFAWSDPGPWLALWSRRLSRRLNRGPARVLTVLRQWRSTAS